MLRFRLLSVMTAGLALALSAPALAAAPGNDAFGSASPLSGTSASVSYTTAEATKQTGEPGVGLGARTVWFKWTPASNGATSVDVCSASWHYVKVYRTIPGQPEGLGTLEIARNADQDFLPADTACQARWRASANTKYFIQVNHQGATPAGTLQLAQDTSPPASPTLGSWPDVTQNFQASFGSPDATGYVCALDGGVYVKCSSPHWIAFQTDGEHTFRVRSLDASGNLSAPTVRTWRFDARGPQVTVTSPNGITAARPTFTWTTDEPGQTYCAVNGGGVGMCSSPWVAPIMNPGTHTLTVFAKDGFGNKGEPTTLTWTVPDAAAQPVVQNWTNPETLARNAALPCTMRLLPPASTTRAALRRGLRVRVTAESGRCVQTLVVKQGTRKLLSRLITLVGPSGTYATVKTRAARRGKLVLTLNGLRRVVTVR